MPMVDKFFAYCYPAAPIIYVIGLLNKGRYSHIIVGITMSAAAYDIRTQNRVRLAIYLCLVVQLNVLLAQSQSLYFQNLSLDEGLSQSTVLAIEQDSLGLMWFCTQDGLSRYDGSAFRIFRKKFSDSTSIAHNRLSAILEDRDGQIWIGTNGGGLARYNPYVAQFTAYTNTERNSYYFPAERVSSLLQDKRGTIWCATENGLLRLQKCK